jgi:hypothetical protein
MKASQLKSAVAAAVLFALSAVGAVAHEGHSRKATVPAAKVQTVTMEGELVDPQCWYTHNGEGAEHAGCAKMCARGGQDLAFLNQETGAQYGILAAGHGKNPNEGMFTHVGVRVRVKGTAYERGVNRGLIVQSVEPVAVGLFDGVKASGSSRVRGSGS